MKAFLGSSVLVLLATIGRGQCTGVIPASALIVDEGSPGVVTGTSAAYWVCGDAMGTTLNVDESLVLIEAGASVQLAGDGNQVWYKGSTPLTVTGDGNNIRVQEFGDVDLQGSGDNTVAYCGVNNVVFNYQFAPAPGCVNVGVADSPVSPGHIRTELDHAQVHIRPDHATLERIELFTLRGERIGTYPGTTRIVDLSQWSDGVYLLRIHSDQGVLTLRFVKG